MVVTQFDLLLFYLFFVIYYYLFALRALRIYKAIVWSVLYHSLHMCAVVAFFCNGPLVNLYSLCLVLLIAFGVVAIKDAFFNFIFVWCTSFARMNVSSKLILLL